MHPQRPSRVLVFFGLALVSAAMLATAPASAQDAGPRILHDGLTCIVAGQHAILDALVEPADDLVTVKAYFRAEIYPAFFYVEMTRTGDHYQAVLPRPSRDIQSVVYYLEAVDTAFNSLRTEEFHPRVALDPSGCDGERPPATYLDGPGAITVGATTEGATFPPGFLTEGIVGTISALGRTAATGGSSGALIGIGAAAGAAAGVAVLVSGGDSDTTTSIPAVGITSTVPPPTTSIPVTTAPPGAGPLTACFDTDPNPPTVPAGGTVRFDASCSGPDRDRIVLFDWDFNDGREGRDGRVITRVYPDAGVFTAELTVTDEAGNKARTSKDVRVEETTAPPPGGGGPPGPPNTADVQVTMSQSTSPGSATYTVRVRNNGPLTANGISFSHSVSGTFTYVSRTITGGSATCSLTPTGITCSNPSMAAGTFFEVTSVVSAASGATLTSSASATSASPPDTVSNNSATLVTNIPLRTTPDAATAIASSFTSRLEIPPGDGNVRAQVTVNDARTDGTDNANPFVHDVRGRVGENVVEAVLLTSTPADGRWRFTFDNAPHFEAGSFTVEAGQVQSRTATEIVFRAGADAQRVRFRYRLSQ